MVAKREKAADYIPAQTGLAERLLLEVWSRLGDYHEYLVLIGGLAPRYIIPRHSAPAPHAGTLDVDLGISIAFRSVCRDSNHPDQINGV